MSRRSTSYGGNGSIGPGALSRPDELRVEKVYLNHGIPMAKASFGCDDYQVFDPDNLAGFSSEVPETIRRRRYRQLEAMRSDFGG